MSISHQLKCILFYLTFLSILSLEAKENADVEFDAFLDFRNTTYLQQKTFLNDDINSNHIENYIRLHWENIKSESTGLELISEKYSPGGVHYAYRHTLYDVPVYQTYLKVNLDNYGYIRSTFNNAYDVSHVDMDILKSKIDAYNTSSISERIKSLYPEDVIFHNEELVLLYSSENSQPEPYLALDYEWSSQLAIDRILINAESEIIHTVDLKTYHGQNLMIEIPATVFLPDPLTTAEVSYGAAYTDQDDIAVTELNNERDTVMIEVSIDGFWYVLENEYVKLADLEAPDIDPIDSASPNFYYGREEDGFEQVNCYYHLNNQKSYLTSLGFDSIHTEALIVDAHGVNGADNSYFSANAGAPRLVFGEGCVDDGEDADVIVHENGHHISWSAAPGSNIGFERSALDEGIGDYWAASYSRHISEYKWWEVFSWDGHNTCWSGRSADLDIHYPEDVNSSIHSTGQIWSTALMNIWDDLGRETTDALMMQANFGFSADMTMSDAAALFLQADSLLNSGDNALVIMKHMYEIGLLGMYVLAGEDKLKCPTESRTIGAIQPAYDHVVYSWSPASGVLDTEQALSSSTADVSTTYTLTATDTLTETSATDEMLLFVYFCEVGIEESIDGIKLLNSHGFTYNNEAAQVSIEQNTPAQISIYDVTGKVILNQSFTGVYDIHPSLLSTGVYIVNISTDSAAISEKLIKN